MGESKLWSQGDLDSLVRTVLRRRVAGRKPSKRVWRRIKRRLQVALYFLFCLESVYYMSQILLKGPKELGRF